MYAYRHLLDLCFPSFLHRARKAHKLSQAELANRIGMSRPWVSKLERLELREMPPVMPLLKLADALGLPYADVLDAAGYDMSDPNDRLAAFLEYEGVWEATPPAWRERLPDFDPTAPCTMPEEARHTPSCLQHRERQRARSRQFDALSRSGEPTAHVASVALPADDSDEQEAA
jgi:transcriptional regulator with XRE-family HTH domain